MPRQKAAEAFNPLVGVRSDFSKVLKLFADSDSVRYEQFSQIWRECKMSFIFVGRDTERELRMVSVSKLRFLLPFFDLEAFKKKKKKGLYRGGGQQFMKYLSFQFTEDLLNIAVELWMPPANFQARVGALYLLYGLYFKQHSEPKCKVILCFIELVCSKCLQIRMIVLLKSFQWHWKRNPNMFWTCIVCA